MRGAIIDYPRSEDGVWPRDVKTARVIQTEVDRRTSREDQRNAAPQNVKSLRFATSRSPIRRRTFTRGLIAIGDPTPKMCTVRDHNPAWERRVNGIGSGTARGLPFSHANHRKIRARVGVNSWVGLIGVHPPDLSAGAASSLPALYQPFAIRRLDFHSHTFIPLRCGIAVRAAFRIPNMVCTL
jgi:hypothetical protein